jgi:hypothetical protein
MMDSNVIAKLLENKEILDKSHEAQRLTLVCEQIYGSDWDAFYAVCDLQLVAFGAKVGVYDTIASTNTKKYATYLNNVVTTLSTLAISCDPNTSLKRNTKSIIRALRILRKYAHYRDAFILGESVQCTFSEVEIKFCACCICKNV